MPAAAKKNLDVALTCFNCYTKPDLLKKEKDFFKNKAVSLTQAAIEKLPQESIQKINATLENLEKEYDAFQNKVNSMPKAVETGVNEKGEIEEREVPLNAQEILQDLKAQLCKIAQAAFAPQDTKTSAVSQSVLQQKAKQDLKLQECQNLQAKLNELSANKSLSSDYPEHFKQVETNLAYAKNHYAAGNFTFGDQQYGYASEYVTFLQSKK